MAEFHATEKLRVECHDDCGKIHSDCSHTHGRIESPPDKHPGSRRNGNQVIDSCP